MKPTCTRKIEFDYGHRVHLHESKCRNLHGHRGVVEVTAEGLMDEGLDSLGRVIDFGVLKEKLGGWIDASWDHGMILFQEDPIADLWTGDLSDHRVYLLDSNPTAENLARYLGEKVCPLLFDAELIDVVKIVFRETPNCWATWEKN